MLRPVRNNVANMVSRAIVKGIDDAKKFQALQIELLGGEVSDEVERVQNYGFTSVPLAGAEAVAVCVGGKRDHAVVIAVEDRRYRIKNLESGEVAVYTDQGDKMVFKRGGTIEVTASTKVMLLTPLVECSTDLKVSGKIDATGNITSAATITGDTVSDGGKILGTHTHPGSSLTTTATIGLAGPASISGDTGAPN